MAWTYSGDPGTSDRDAVRFLVGDTDTADQLVQDTEIEFALEQEGDIRNAAAAVCEAIAALFSRKVDKGAGITRYSLSQKAEAYAKRAKELRALARRAIAPVPYAGGISESDKEAVAADLDRVGSAFAIGMHDAP